jgi:hypothetical protein
MAQIKRLKFPLTADRSRVIEMITLAPDGYIVEIHQPSRTLEQNALYWSTVHEVAEQCSIEGRKFTPQVWHIYFKQRFLPGRIVELPNGQIMEAEPTTTDLTKEEFSEFVEEVIQFKESHT